MLSKHLSSTSEHQYLSLIMHSIFVICLLCLASLSAFASSSDQSGIQVFTNVNVINPTGAESIENARVVIENGKITSVGPADKIAIPSAAVVIDADGGYLIPGLIDAHIHFHSNGSSLYNYSGGKPEIEDVIEPFRSSIIRPKEYLESAFLYLLRSGVTTVRSMGESRWAYSRFSSIKNELKHRSRRELCSPVEGFIRGFFGPMIGV